VPQEREEEDSGRDPGARSAIACLSRQLLLRFALRATVGVDLSGVAGPARALPVRFELAPPAEKPKKGASAEEQAAYRQEKKRRALTVVGRNAMASVRQSMDQRERCTIGS